MQLSYDQAMILLSSIYPRELNIYAHTKSVEEYIEASQFRGLYDPEEQ